MEEETVIESSLGWVFYVGFYPVDSHSCVCERTLSLFVALVIFPLSFYSFAD